MAVATVAMAAAPVLARAGAVPGAAAAEPTTSALVARHGGDSDLHALCRKYDRCFSCGMHVPAATIAEHKTKCPRDTARLKQRMGIVRKMDARGASKEEVNTFKTRAA